jgi:hypothetical protein
MSMTLKSFFDGQTTAYYDPMKTSVEVFIDSAAEWEAHVKAVLEALQPNGAAEFQRLCGSLGRFLPSTIRANTPKTAKIKGRLEESEHIQFRNIYVTTVDQLASAVFDTITLPPPGFTDNEYGLTPGVICIGTIFTANNHALRAKWLNGRKTYSGNFPNHANDAVWKLPNGPFDYKGNFPARDQIMQVKASIGGMILLSSTRHAEDEWFGRHLPDFATDVQGIIATAPTYDCNSSVFEQVQALPRIVFQVTCNPCLADDRIANNKGCVRYFGELLRPRAGNLPIVIYWHRPYDPTAALKGKHVFTIKGDGNCVAYPNGW